MKERYYILNSSILFKKNEENNMFYIYDANNFNWELNSTLMDKYYDAAYDIIEISEREAQNIIESLKGGVKKL